MTKLVFALLIFISFTLNAQEAPVAKAANNAFTLIRIAQQKHVQPRPVNDSFSAHVFEAVFAELDPAKLFFTSEDVNLLQPYRLMLDDEIMQKKTVFLTKLASLYKHRIARADSIVSQVAKNKLNLFSTSSFNKDEAEAWAATTGLLKEKWIKFVTYQVIADIAEQCVDTANNILPGLEKRADSLEAVSRMRLVKRYQRLFQRMMNRPGGLEQLAYDDYCKAVAAAFDPHTAFLSKTEKENFEGSLGKMGFDFGFLLEENESGQVVVEKLVPGTQAFKCGLINRGDKLLAIQWAKNNPIEMSEASLDEVHRALAANNDQEVKFSFKKPDGTTRQVSLSREVKQEKEDDDEDWVSSYLLQGPKKVGYIKLPSFYEDWENEVNINGCANDVAKEIMKLKKENIQALVLDLRDNSGGSANEAVELAGIFLDAGPVVMIKMRDEKPATIKDLNRGTLYDGPLVVMVNEYSASASEMFAACMQDYNRALIVGSTTYGKGTGQVLLPLDTTISEEDFLAGKKTASSFIKVTLSEFFRVNGSATQFKGVEPDVAIPTAATEVSREQDEKTALRFSTIEANKYYRPLPALDRASAVQKAKAAILNDDYFRQLDSLKLKQVATNKQRVSLNLKTYLAANYAKEQPTQETKDAKPIFTVENNSYEAQRLQLNPSQQFTNNFFRSLLQLDPELKIVYSILQ